MFYFCYDYKLPYCFGYSFCKTQSLTALVTSGCKVINYSYGSSSTIEELINDEERTKAFEDLLVDYTKEYNEIFKRLDNKGYDFLMIKSAGNSAKDSTEMIVHEIIWANFPEHFTGLK